jgi:hypothetical protein
MHFVVKLRKVSYECSHGQIKRLHEGFIFFSYNIHMHLIPGKGQPCPG